MELPHLGVHCSHPSCNQLDFLPVTCRHCSKQYCHLHSPISSHSCTITPEELDAKTLTCPLCHQIIPLDRTNEISTEQVNSRVERHISLGCPDETVRLKKKYSNRCFVKGCKVKSLTPVLCQSCLRNYCLKHRFPGDHGCGSISINDSISGSRASSRASLESSGSSSSSSSSSIQEIPNTSNTTTTSNNNNNNLTEDEQLAMAIQLSLQQEEEEEEQRRRRNGNTSNSNTTSNNTDNQQCIIN